MSRRTASSTTASGESEVPAVLAKRIDDLEEAVRNVASLASEWTDTLRAVCAGTLALIDGTERSALAVAELVMHIRDELHDMDNTIGAECESVGCGHVPHRMETVLAQIDRAAASQARPG